SKPNRIIVHNQLGSGIHLQYHCRSNLDDDTGVKTLNNFNSNWTLRWVCDLSFQTDKEYYFNELQVYRQASIRRHNQLRHRIDGIYFTRNYDKPVERVLDWNSTKI
ncbi:hypothetical protein EUTSA_v10003328mg, partial [Eutrema salsugineum]